jgi:phage protein D
MSTLSLSDAAKAIFDDVRDILTIEPRPAWSIIVNGANITTDISARLNSLTLTDAKGFEADMLELCLDDTDGKLDLPPRGAKIQCAIGWKGTGTQLTDKGLYIVDEIEYIGAPDMITIRARSADMRASMSVKRDQSWHDTTLGKIVDEIAARNSLASACHADARPIIIQHEDQATESDASFLSRLCGEHAVIVMIKNGSLLAIPSGAGTTAGGTILPVITITRRSGDRHTFSVSDRESCQAVNAQWHDIRLGKHGTIVADSKGVRDLDADPAEIRKDAAIAQDQADRAQKRATKARALAAKDKSLLAQARAERAAAVASRRTERAKELSAQSQTTTSSAHTPNDPTLPDTGATKTLRHVYGSRYSAERAAKATFQRIQEGTAEFSITLARGREDLLPELPVIVSGFKPQIDNAPWKLGPITHTINETGFTTSIRLAVDISELKD